MVFRSEDSDFFPDGWILVYNNTHPEWTLEGISANMNYEFRVRSYNEYGYSNYSYSEKPFYLPETGGTYPFLIQHLTFIVQIIGEFLFCD